jgi:ABC-type multidrug transport system ATPase subunit
MIVAENLRKTFPTSEGDDKVAVDSLSFAVPRGEIYGLLGPNGAGKTTTLRMLSGLIAPSGGRAVLDGIDVAEHPDLVKRNIGFLTANTGLYQRLSPRELLLFFAALYGLDSPAAKARVDHLLEWLDMRSFAELRCGALSTGQKQRTNIARALVGNPAILIMDEPTLGLDVLSNRIILDFIRRERAAGKTILLSTHYLDEAESLCDRIGLLYAGRLVAEGDLAALQAASGQTRLSSIFLKLVGQPDSMNGTTPDSLSPAGPAVDAAV